MTATSTSPEVDLGTSSDDPAAQGWRRHGDRWAISAEGRRGNVFRRGEETPAQALARDAEEQTTKTSRQAPKRRAATPPAPNKPPAPTEVDLKSLEYNLTQGLKAPSIACGMLGDDWPAQHITTNAPILARNLIETSRHNPWLREKLEQMAAGDDWTMKLINSLGLAGALAFYAIPPFLYYLGDLAPRGAKEMFEVPDRAEIQAEKAQRRRMEEDLARAQAAASAAPAAAPAPVAAAA